MAEGSEVTFVGGIAVEQSEAQESNLEPDERAEAMKAVKEAIEAAGKEAAEETKAVRAKDPLRELKDKAAKEDADESGSDSAGSPDRGPDGKFLPKADKPKAEPKPAPKEEPAEEDFDPASASVKQLLKHREKVATLKRDAKDEISKERAAFEAEKRQVAQAWQQTQRDRAELQRQHEAFQSLRKDPARAVREIGYDPEQFIMDLATEGTPEGVARRRQQEIDAQLAEIRQWKVDQQKAQEQAQYNHHLRQAETARHNAVRDFTNLGLNEDKYPHVASLYKGKERALVALGDITAEEYRSLSGKEGSFEEILDYLEDELATSMNGWYSKKVGSQKAGNSTQKAPPAKSKGKSLSPDGSGERRALAPKDLGNLDDDERLEAAKQAVRIAMAESN